MTHPDGMPCQVYIDGGWWGTDWNDPLIYERSWIMEEAEIFCHFYYIEHCLNDNDLPF